MYIFLCVMFGSMAMLVKEHGITVFGVCVIYDCLVIHKRFIWRLESKIPFLCSLVWVHLKNDFVAY